MDINNLFGNQFAKREYLETPFGKIETVDIIPQKIKEAIPILLASGWGETLELQKNCIKEIYLSGSRVIALQHATLIQRLTKRSFYPAAELQKAQTLLLLLNYKNIKRVDAVSHSEGSINVAIAATLEPKLFRNLVLVTPAGLLGEDSKIRLVIGFLKHLQSRNNLSISQLLMKLKNLSKLKHQSDTNFLNILFSLQKELSAMTSFDIHPLLINLRKQGIKITILAGETDTAFPLQKMKKHLERGIIEYKLHTEQEKKNYGIDIFATKKGGHELYTNTHEIVKQVLSLLDELKK